MPLLTADAEHVVAWLRTVRFCDGLDSEQLAVIASECRVRPFVAGETLASAGDEVTEFWILVEGELDSFLTNPRGREEWLATIRQGETVGELAILEKAPTRPLRFTARTHGTLLVAPAALLHEWVKSYPQVMQNLFHTLSERFKLVAGVAARSLPSPRLGIVATSPRGCVLAGRLAARLLAAGERLRAWAGQPSSLTSTGSWPDALPIQELAASDTPLLQPPSPDVDRQIVVWSPGSNGRTEFKQLLGCDEVLWLLEPRDAANVSQDLHSLNSLQGELAQKVRIVWLLDADTPVAPLLSGWEFKKADVKVAVESTGGALTRQERQGLDRLVRALRGISVGLALAGGGAKGMAHFGVLHALEEAGLSFDVMSGTSAGAMAGILYASGMPPRTSNQALPARSDAHAAVSLLAQVAQLVPCVAVPPPRLGWHAAEISARLATGATVDSVQRRYGRSGASAHGGAAPRGRGPRDPRKHQLADRLKTDSARWHGPGRRWRAQQSAGRRACRKRRRLRRGS